MGSQLADILYRRRKALNLTQEKLADMVGVKPVYIGYLERGKRHPSPKVTAKLADALGLNRSFLFLAGNPVVGEFLEINEDDFSLASSPLPQSLLDLRADVGLCAAHNISDEDLATLEKLAFLGEPDSKLEYVMLIEVIRRVFGRS